MMCGDLGMSYGQAWINGYNLKKNIRTAQKYIGYCPQVDAFLEDMTVFQTIRIFCLLRGIKWKDTKFVADFLANELDFTKVLNKTIKNLSGGNKRKISMAVALIGNPPVLFLDEPTAGTC